MTVERIEYQAGNTACSGALVYDETRQRTPAAAADGAELARRDRRRHQARGDDGRQQIRRLRRRHVWRRQDLGRAAGSAPNWPMRCAPTRRSAAAASPPRSMRCAAKATSATSAISTRQAAVGFCFGGGNVLELARTGADLQAVVCLHGDLLTPLPAKPGDIKAAVCVLHGSAGSGGAEEGPRRLRGGNGGFRREMADAGVRRPAAFVQRRSSPTCRASRATMPAPRGRATTWSTTSRPPRSKENYKNANNSGKETS